LIRLVLDASVALAWCFEDEANEYADGVLNSLVEALVPGNWPLEMANSLVLAQRRKRIEPANVLRFVRFLAEVPITVDPLTAEKALKETLAVATERRLTAYDAAYLELAMRQGVPLATLDSDLRRAAQEAGAALF